MSDSVIIALIIVLGIVVLGVVALVMLKNHIGSAQIKGSKQGVAMDMQARKPVYSKVSGNIAEGHRNAFTAKNSAQVDKNQATGDENKFSGS